MASRAAPGVAGLALVLGGPACTGAEDTGETRPAGRYSAVGALGPDGRWFYVVGGGSAGGVLQDAWRFDVQAATWERLGDPPAAMLRGTAVRDGERLLVFGGEDQDYVDRSWLWQWDLAADSWTLLDEGGGPSPRKKHAAAWVGDTLLVHGGHHNDVDPALILSDSWAWRDGWTRLAEDSGQAAYRHGLVADEGGQLAWGHAGFDGTDSRTDRLFQLSVGDGLATEVAQLGELPPVRASHSLVLAPGPALGRDQAQLVAWGGHATDDSTWSFDPAGATWTEHPHQLAPLPRDAQVSELSADGGTLYLLCGDPVSEEVADFVCDAWALDLATMTWTELAGPE